MVLSAARFHNGMIRCHVLCEHAVVQPRSTNSTKARSTSSKWQDNREHWDAPQDATIRKGTVRIRTLCENIYARSQNVAKHYETWHVQPAPLYMRTLHRSSEICKAWKPWCKCFHLVQFGPKQWQSQSNTAPDSLGAGRHPFRIRRALCSSSSGAYLKQVGKSSADLGFVEVRSDLLWQIIDFLDFTFGCSGFTMSQSMPNL